MGARDGKRWGHREYGGQTREVTGTEMEEMVQRLLWVKNKSKIGRDERSEMGGGEGQK